MEEKQAQKAVAEWMRAHDEGTERERAEALYGPLVLELRQLLPDGCMAGAASFNGRPAVVGCDDGSLFVVSATQEVSERSQTMVIEARRASLTSADAAVELSERVTLAGPPSPGRVRRWQFSLPGLDGALEIETEEALPAVHRAVPSAENLARAIAAAVGWRVAARDLAEL